MPLRAPRVARVDLHALLGLLPPSLLLPPCGISTMRCCRNQLSVVIADAICATPNSAGSW
jgi:hypothetical protein